MITPRNSCGFLNDVEAASVQIVDEILACKKAGYTILHGLQQCRFQRKRIAIQVICDQVARAGAHIRPWREEQGFAAAAAAAFAGSRRYSAP